MGGTFDKAAPLPAPVRAASAKPGSATPTRKRVEFATPSGASAGSTATRVPMDSVTGDASATPASGGAARGYALQSVSWAREDERAARRQAARQPSPDLKTIDAANRAEFDDKFAQEIASEGLQLDRDWYLREEEGGIDGDEGHALGDEITYSRGKAATGGANAPVRSSSAVSIETVCIAPCVCPCRWRHATLQIAA
jgi:hypothetical protein